MLFLIINLPAYPLGFTLEMLLDASRIRWILTWTWNQLREQNTGPGRHCRGAWPGSRPWGTCYNGPPYRTRTRGTWCEDPRRLCPLEWRKILSFWTLSITHKGAIEYHQNDVFIYTCTKRVLPIFRWSTPSPTLLMTPLTSWPRSSGLVTTKWPMPPSFQYLTSEPQIPTCWTAIWTSGTKIKINPKKKILSRCFKRYKEPSLSHKNIVTIPVSKTNLSYVTQKHRHNITTSQNLHTSHTLKHRHNITTSQNLHMSHRNIVTISVAKLSHITQ